MDKIINILLLIIIFVFDPLAISLVVAANFAFDKAYPKKNIKKIYMGKEVEPEKNNSTLFPDDYDENRMNIIGQNGNDGEHYEDMDNINNIMENDGVRLIRQDGRELEKKVYFGNIVKMFKPKQNLKDEDDLTKTY